MERQNLVFRLLFAGSFIALFIGSASGQRNVRDSLVFAPHISFSYAQQFPGGDMAERFGSNSNVGLSFNIKDLHNFFYGVDVSYLFSDNVTQPGLLQNLMTENGEILANDGEIAEVLVQQRGWLATASGGKLFSLRNSNPNTGILVKGGVGFMAHKIRLETQMHTVTQLEDEYVRGYDRLTTGLVLTQFVGYFYMSDNRLTNFFAGVEAFQGFTAGRRSYTFDTQSIDTQPRLDLLLGLRAGWCIHIYKRTWRNVYY